MRGQAEGCALVIDWTQPALAIVELGRQCVKTWQQCSIDRFDHDLTIDCWHGKTVDMVANNKTHKPM